ncbi:hypothetical protein LINPERPRIM_LOCUS42970 [Linum perenne]
MPFAPQVSPTEVPKLPIPDDGALSKAAGRARNLLLDWPPPPSYPDRGRKEGDRIKAASAEPTLTSFRIGEQVPTSSSWSGTGASYSFFPSSDETTLAKLKGKGSRLRHLSYNGSVYGLPTKSRISLLTPEEGNQELYTSETENPLKEVWMSLGSAEAIRNGRRRKKGRGQRIQSEGQALI